MKRQNEQSEAFPDMIRPILQVDEYSNQGVYLPMSFVTIRSVHGVRLGLFPWDEDPGTHVRRAEKSVLVATLECPAMVLRSIHAQ